MTLKEEILKNSGVLTEASVGNVNLIRTPVGFFEIKSKIKWPKIHYNEESYDYTEEDFRKAYDYVDKSDVKSWEVEFDDELNRFFNIEFSKDNDFIRLALSHEDGKKVLALLIKKLNSNVFNKGFKECKDTLINNETNVDIKDINYLINFIKSARGIK